VLAPEQLRARSLEFAGSCQLAALDDHCLADSPGFLLAASAAFGSNCSVLDPSRRAARSSSIVDVA
jgi:hypothetical protein